MGASLYLLRGGGDRKSVSDEMKQRARTCAEEFTRIRNYSERSGKIYDRAEILSGVYSIAQEKTYFMPSTISLTYNKFALS